MSVRRDPDAPKGADPPPFTRLQGVIGLAALLMTTMVLTTQNISPAAM